MCEDNNIIVNTFPCTLTGPIRSQWFKVNILGRREWPRRSSLIQPASYSVRAQTCNSSLGNYNEIKFEMKWNSTWNCVCDGNVGDMDGCDPGASTEEGLDAAASKLSCGKGKFSLPAPWILPGLNSMGKEIIWQYKLLSTVCQGHAGISFSDVFFLPASAAAASRLHYLFDGVNACGQGQISITCHFTTALVQPAHEALPQDHPYKFIPVC